jgi:hypothetical protein
MLRAGIIVPVGKMVKSTILLEGVKEKGQL